MSGRSGAHRQVRLTVVLVLAAVLLAVWIFRSAGAGTPDPCMEDMKCWDCATMGNKRCGP